MKRLLALLLSLFMLLSLAACGGDSTPDNTEKQNINNANNNSNNNNDNNNTNQIQFTEAVAIDNAECTVKFTGIDPDNMWGYTLNVLLENKSAEKTYMFSVDRCSVNGVECDPLFASEVAPGKKANEQIHFMDSTLEENGIVDYTDIALTFRVYDSNDWLADPVAETTVHIYPYGEDKAVKFVREAQNADIILVDNAYVTVIVTGYENDEIWGYTVKLFLVNKTDKNVMFTVEDVSVNGFMAEPLYADSVGAGNCAFSSISWADYILEENKITNIEEIEFVLRAYDEDNWETDDFVSQKITLHP